MVFVGAGNPRHLKKVSTPIIFKPIKIKNICFSRDIEKKKKNVEKLSFTLLYDRKCD